MREPEIVDLTRFHPPAGLVPPFAYTWARVMDNSVWLYDMADQPAYAWESICRVNFDPATPYRERIRVLDALVDMYNIRLGGAS